MHINENAIYIGEWSSDELRHGKGKQIWSDGSIYEGYWKHDKACGCGRMFYANGELYEGEWKEGMRHGEGLMIYESGSKYEGQFEEDQC